MQCLSIDAVFRRQVDRGFIRVGAVAIAIAQGVRAFVSNVGHGEGQAGSEGALRAEVPGVERGELQRVGTRLGVDLAARIRQQAVSRHNRRHIGIGNRSTARRLGRSVGVIGWVATGVIGRAAKAEGLAGRARVTDALVGEDG